MADQSIVRLKSSDMLAVRNRSLRVNGRPFRLAYPDEPICCVEDGKLVTLVVWGCGISMTRWEAEEIMGYWIENGAS